jgi:hypothetical protein
VQTSRLLGNHASGNAAPVGEHWIVAIALAHLAFWDRRVMYVLDMTKRDGALFIPEIGIFVNDLSLPLWAAIPPREAARIAIETADALDRQLEGFPPALLAEIHIYNERWVGSNHQRISAQKSLRHSFN